MNLDLMYTPTGSSDIIIGYCEADWAEDVEDLKLTSGYLFNQGGAAIIWRSCKQSCVALSVAEAEYVTLVLRQLRKLCGCRN